MPLGLRKLGEIPSKNSRGIRVTQAKPKLLLCDCEGSVTTDKTAVRTACSLAGDASFHESLCRTELGTVAEALAKGDLIVACAQESARFEDVSEEVEGAGSLTTFDIRDRALWSDEGEQAGPKVAALLAEQNWSSRATGSIDLESAGVCLVYGSGESAMAAADALSDSLTVTVMLKDEDDALPRWDDPYPVIKGSVRQVSGHLGAFEIVADGVAEAIPGGRGGLAFEAPQDGGRSVCDLIVDLSGDAALVPAHGKRDGYLRADPTDPAAVATVLRQAAGLVGTFEKPLYVDFHAELCAHSRSGQAGCTRCLDVCPTGAISPDGETVKIDPMVCAGCGGCSAVCPSGAAEYAMPRPSDSRMRLQAMLDAYSEAGGTGAQVLIHDEREGRALIAMAARFGRGLPASVIPLAVNEVTQVGHDLLLGALAMGAKRVLIHLPNRVRREGEAAPIDFQVALFSAMMDGVGGKSCMGEDNDSSELRDGNDFTKGSARVQVVETDDPDALCEALYSDAPEALSIEPISPVGDKRAATRLSISALTTSDAPFALPEGAPYGQVVMNVEACTLCLACVSQCPVGALQDNPDKPQVGFREDACLQCGICVNTCPENALKLEPRFNPNEAARRVRVLHEEEPFCCVECGKPFGSGGTVKRILEKLGGKHWMFENPDRARLIQMCDDCRVGAAFAVSDNPFDGGAKPKVRTTQDYLDARAGDKPPKLH